MTDYQKGLKREVAEVKFLIHDLRVERFINEVIHFHVTLNTDLELYDVDQAQVIHGEDLQELKQMAAGLRRSHQDYCNAVTSFSPDRTILLAGKKYVERIYDVCDLILNPLWGRFDKVMSFLPEESRSAQTQSHYRNCLRWVCGVYYRIEHFLDEQGDKDVSERFDVARDLQDFTRNVIYGYVVEKGGARVELQLGGLESAVLEGNRHRFRRMYFNLVMNAVDAMVGKKVGVIHVSTAIEGERAVMRVRDTGSGMPADKVRQLLADKESLDGELHSLGFVFVRQTIAEYGGELSIESEPGKGTEVVVSLSFLAAVEAPPARPSRCEKFELSRTLPPALPEAGTGAAGEGEQAGDGPATAQTETRGTSYGALVLSDFQRSDAQPPGCIFAMASQDDGEIDFFTHRPYEKFWNISHEDLSPMFFEATIRGRMEQDDELQPMLILKSAQNIREYFEFKEVAEKVHSQERFAAMLRDELIRIARKLIETGLPAETGVVMSDLEKLFGDCPELLEKEPFELGLLAGVRQAGEGGG